jgi:hypothetical protein
MQLQQFRFHLSTYQGTSLNGPLFGIAVSDPVSGLESATLI